MSGFIVDTHLPPLLRDYIIGKGFHAIHTIDCPNKEHTEDSEIATIAIAQNRIVITKDSDFHDAYLIKGAPPRILLLKFGNCSNKDLIEIFEKHLDQVNFYFEVQHENFLMLWKDFIAII